MTPFMLRVQDLLDGEVPAPPQTRPSRPRPIAQGADTQLMVRALAEQLVSEANAVLRPHGEVIDLRDEVGPGELVFTMSYGGRTARVQTLVTQRQAMGRLSAPGLPAEQSRQLSSDGEVEALVLTLLRAPARP